MNCLLRGRESHPHRVPVRYPTGQPTAPAVVFLLGWQDSHGAATHRNFAFVPRSRPEDAPLFLSPLRSLQSQSSHGKISTIATFTPNMILPLGTFCVGNPILLYPRVALFMYL